MIAKAYAPPEEFAEGKQGTCELCAKTTTFFGCVRPDADATEFGFPARSLVYFYYFLCHDCHDAFGDETYEKLIAKIEETYKNKSGLTRQ